MMTAAPPPRRQPITPFSLSETDEEMLQSLARYQFMTAEQWRRYFEQPGKLRYPQDRSRLLAANDYLLRLSLPTPRGKGRAPSLFALGLQGRRYCEQKHLLLPRRFRPIELHELHASHRTHTKTITDVLLSFDLLARHDERFVVTELQHERFLHEQRFKVPVPEVDRRTGEITMRGIEVVPDAFVRVAGQLPSGKTRRFPLVIEVDGDSEFQEAFRGKVRQLVSFGRSEGYQRVYNARSLNLAFFVYSPRRDPNERLAKLLDYTETELTQSDSVAAAGSFAFCAADPITTPPVDLLTGSVWFRPFQRRPVPLLDLREEGGV